LRQFNHFHPTFIIFHPTFIIFRPDFITNSILADCPSKAQYVSTEEWIQIFMRNFLINYGQMTSTTFPNIQIGRSFAISSKQSKVLYSLSVFKTKLLKNVLWQKMDSKPFGTQWLEITSDCLVICCTSWYRCDVKWA
jgi:hypothetical protein